MQDETGPAVPHLQGKKSTRSVPKLFDELLSTRVSVEAMLLCGPVGLRLPEMVHLVRCGRTRVALQFMGLG